MSEAATNGNGAADGKPVTVAKKKRCRKVRSMPAKNWRRKYLKEIARSPNLTLAAERAQVSTDTARLHRKKDKRFAAAFEQAWRTGYDRLMGISQDRAMYGTKNWGYFKDGAGRLVKRELPPTIHTTEAIFHLKAEFPSRFRETVHAEISGPQGGPIDLSMGITIQWPHEAAKLNGNGHEPKQIQAAVTSAEPEAGDDNAAAAAPSAD